MMRDLGPGECGSTLQCWDPVDTVNTLQEQGAQQQAQEPEPQRERRAGQISERSRGRLAEEERRLPPEVVSRPPD